MSQVVDQKKCVTCGADFSVFEEDRELLDKMKVYDKYDIPDPIECWDCRQQRRQAQRNERNLYPDECDKCGKNMLSIFSPDKEATVYCPKCWWGGEDDPLDYGREFDFGRPFFDQWKELYHEVPRMSLIVLGEQENSDYAHDAYRLKNCFLTFDGEQSWDCMYGETFYKLKDCMDFLVASQCELCYEVVNCSNCYNSKFCKFCKTCSESAFLYDCVGCKDCFACCNLSQAKFCIFNEQYSEKDYKEKLEEYKIDSYEGLEKFKKEFAEFVVKQPKRAYRGVKNEEVIGDHIDNCKDCYYCFDCAGLRDCRYCTNVVVGANDCMDVDIWGENMNLAYNCECVGAGAQELMCNYYAGRNVGNVYYSAFCWDSSFDLFGCVGLRHKNFCILNKKYSEDEYHELLERIVAHMRETGEWGQFMPAETSWFGYNETVAHEFYPLDRDAVKERGWNWMDIPAREFAKQKYEIPNAISDVPDSIVDEILGCSECGRNYKVTPQELKYYRRFGVPIPRLCYNCRHYVRRRSKNPRRLWQRKCARSRVPVWTSYSPDRMEDVWSPEEYVKEFF
ncbi:hypothetical protein HOG17_01460 [Candidatus Peregrinibacteria bacterium]|jgi:hypothetical protein|nr:hypothetical protein [Candidatus Peregrinibacteria bacterium]MBT4148400.1 hypothetical protein [Candidatus Peregrinibacteria bacterium]MBT4456090.1 hypothetical protein [Candidatus Peregrinibacteria bacterium]